MDSMIVKNGENFSVTEHKEHERKLLCKSTADNLGKS